MIALGAIALGVAALIFAGGFIEWILRELREETIRTQLGHIHVMFREGKAQAGSATPDVASSRTAELVATLSSLPHVKSVLPRLSFSGLISTGETTLSFIGEGIDITKESLANVPGEKPLAVFRGKEDRIALGEGLATSLEVGPGDKVVLIANTPKGGVNAVDARVADVFHTISKDYDDVALRAALPLTQQLVRSQRVDHWIVFLDETDATESTLLLMRSDPRLDALSFTPWTERADFYNKAVVLYSRQFEVVRILTAIIIILSISNTLIMSVSERTPEIGTMMALGTPRRDVLRLFVLEGAALGAIGGLFGIAIGYALNTFVSIWGIPMPPAPGMRHGFTAQALFTVSLATSAFLVAMTTTTLASLYPASRASKLDIVDALRHAH